MRYTRIYAPAKEQGLLTDQELLQRYGRRWKSIIKAFKTETVESDKWYQNLLKKK